jgi:NAD+ kinase
MLLHDNVVLKIQVPYTARHPVSISFDGRCRINLSHGEYVCITTSKFPMVSVSANGSTDWFESLQRCLHWNQRSRQKGKEDNENVGDWLEIKDEDVDLGGLAKMLFPDMDDVSGRS